MFLRLRSLWFSKLATRVWGEKCFLREREIVGEKRGLERFLGRNYIFMKFEES